MKISNKIVPNEILVEDILRTGKERESLIRWQKQFINAVIIELGLDIDKCIKEPVIVKNRIKSLRNRSKEYQNLVESIAKKNKEIKLLKHQIIHGRKK